MTAQGGLLLDTNILVHILRLTPLGQRLLSEHKQKWQRRSVAILGLSWYPGAGRQLLVGEVPHALEGVHHPVRRPKDDCVALGALRGGLQLYGEELPKDRYAPEDFRDGPELPQVDDEQCRDVEVCAEDERRITACTGERYCCRLRPMLDN